jgi:antitoxin (DNA-binding transcriptional repressor) of toxin-antitoxin stability system
VNSSGDTPGERAIDLRHAQTQLPELVRRAARGETVILSEDGEPVARRAGLLTRAERLPVIGVDPALDASEVTCFG